MAALVGTSPPPAIKDIYARLVAAGKPKKAALTARICKLLTILNAMHKNNDAQDPMYHCHAPQRGSIDCCNAQTIGQVCLPVWMKSKSLPGVYNPLRLPAHIWPRTSLHGALRCGAV